MDMKKYIKEYYRMGLYTNEQMKVFVKAKWITEVEYQEITGIEYLISV